MSSSPRTLSALGVLGREKVSLRRDGGHLFNLWARDSAHREALEERFFSGLGARDVSPFRRASKR